jgi:DNA repair exonuclease SbcCD ATPase subunit
MNTGTPDNQLPRNENDLALTAPAQVRRRTDHLLWKSSQAEAQLKKSQADLKQVEEYLAISKNVSDALETLNQQLFKELLAVVEEKLTIALQEVLDQPISLHAEVEFKRGSSAVEFWVERNGNKEDVYRGQGGSVANVLSVGLRMFALTTLDESEHRRFLVLDEQDCWLRPDLVPKLVKIIRDAGRALGFQVLMVSHHDLMIFERYADRIYQFQPTGDGSVEVQLVGSTPDEPDEQAI